MPHRSTMYAWRSMALIALALCAMAFVAAHARDRTPMQDDGYVAETLNIAGDTRDYWVRRPVGDRPPSAIVLLLHGGSGHAERLIGRRTRAAPYRHWAEIADREGLVLVAPQGADGSRGRPGWNDCRTDEDSGQLADDVAFLTSLVETLRRQYRIHDMRAYAVGTSNGGMMALRLAMERPHTFAAIAAIVASMPSSSECAAATRAVPVLMINGTEDALVPYAGGEIAGQFGGRGTALPVETAIGLWARLAGGRAPPVATALTDRDPNDGTSASQMVFASRQGRPVVELIRIEGGGHAEPSIDQRYTGLVARLLGKQSGDFESAEMVWRFFEAQR